MFKNSTGIDFAIPELKPSEGSNFFKNIQRISLAKILVVSTIVGNYQLRSYHYDKKYTEPEIYSVYAIKGRKR